MNKKYGIAIAIIVVLAALGGGLYYFHRETEQKKEAEAFRGAAESTNALVLRNYIFSYPEAPQAHRDSILARLQLLDQEEDVWAEAIVSRTRAKLQAYIDRYPNSVHRPEVLFCLDSIDWVSANSADSEEAYADYISKHADGEHIDEAMQKYNQRQEARLQLEADSINQAVADSLSKEQNRNLTK